MLTLLSKLTHAVWLSQAELFYKSSSPNHSAVSQNEAKENVVFPCFSFKKSDAFCNNCGQPSRCVSYVTW